MLMGTRVDTRTGGGRMGNGGGGNEGMDIEMVPEIGVRSPGLVNGGGLAHIKDVCKQRERRLSP